MELCVEETEVTGDYGLSLQAFTMTPLIGNIKSITSRKSELKQYDVMIASNEQKRICRSIS